jgi:hypothetical protein
METRNFLIRLKKKENFSPRMGNPQAAEQTFETVDWTPPREQTGRSTTGKFAYKLDDGPQQQTEEVEIPTVYYVVLIGAFAALCWLFLKRRRVPTKSSFLPLLSNNPKSS